jgi:hypothetical protein
VAAVPLLVSVALASVVCPVVIVSLRRRGWVRPNHRGVLVAYPAGLAVIATALLALLVLALVDLATGARMLGPQALGVAVLGVGVALLGLLDDLLGDRIAGAPRGLREHARVLARGRVSTGVAKAAGTAALSIGVLVALGLDGAQLLLAASVLTLAAHAFNLLDVRPGRSIKTLLAVGAALSLGSLSIAPIGLLGLVLGPIVVLLGPDLRERSMLGDAGSGAVGAVAGLWIVMTLPVLGQAVALAVLVGVTLLGELRSITALVDRSPPLSKLDSLGRVHA